MVATCAFMEAQMASISVLKTIADGFFKFLEGLQSIVNASIALANKILNLGKVNENRAGFFGGLPGKVAAKWWNGEDHTIAPMDLPVQQMRLQFADLMDGVAKSIAKPAIEQEKQADAAVRAAEKLKQSTDALDQFSGQFKDAFTSPLEMALKKVDQLDLLMSQAIEAGGDPGDILLQYEDAILALSKGVGDAVDQVNAKFGEIKLASAVSAGSTEGYSAIAKFLSGGNNPVDPQEKVERAVKIQTDINKRQLKAASDTYQAIKNLNVGANLVTVNF